MTERALSTDLLRPITGAAYPRQTGTEFLTRCSAMTRDFYSYWDGKRGSRPMPARADLDPIEMKPWLAGLILVDVGATSRDLTYRLVGSNMRVLHQRDVTGLSVVDGYFGDSLEAVLENYRLAIEEKVPVFDWSATPSSFGVMRRAETLLLPLSSDGMKVDKVIVYLEIAPL